MGHVVCSTGLPCFGLFARSLWPAGQLGCGGAVGSWCG